MQRFMPYQKSLTIFLQTPDPNDGQKQTKYIASSLAHIYMVTKVFQVGFFFYEEPLYTM